MKRSVVVVVAVGLLGVGAAPAFANPPVVVVDCPPSPIEALEVCHGQGAGLRCAEVRGLSPSSCRGAVALRSMFDKVGGTPTHFRSATRAEIPESLNLGAIGHNRSVELVVEVDHRSVSFWIDTDKRPPDPRPR